MLERIDDTLQDWLLNTPFEDWLPLGDFAMTPLSLVTEMLLRNAGAVTDSCLLALLRRASYTTPRFSRTASVAAGWE